MPKMISIGATGPDVQLCQKSLNSAFPKTPMLAVDGRFGPATLARVKEFQKSVGLAADGIVGTNTWSKLLAAADTAQRSAVYSGEMPVSKCCGAEQNLIQIAQMAAKDYEAYASVLGIVTPLAQSVKYSTVPTSAPANARRVNVAEKAILIGVFGSSIDFDTVLMTNLTGAGGRAFVLTIKAGFGVPAIQIVNAGQNPTNDTLAHEFTHVWQSQHSGNPMQYMASAVACQALESATNAGMGKKVCSAYAYVPGKAFTSYNVEQIAQQVGNGVAAIQSHCRSVAKNTICPKAVACETNIHVEYWAIPGATI